MKKVILSSKGLKKYYGSGHTEVKAVDGIDLDVCPGEIVLIMGPSGSGKTTMLSMLGGLLSPNSGSVEIEGIDITSLPGNKLPQIRALKLGFVFQAFNLLEALTVEENILFPASLKAGGKKEAQKRADDLISRLGLTERRNVLPKTLSGGEKQRVAIARALINEPSVILADEPTGNLDSKSGQEVMMILHDVVRDEGCTVVIVTHDPRVEDIADRILWLEDGKLRDRKNEEHHWVYDPVCRMRIDEWTATLFSEYEGTNYAFCSKRCKERFSDNPGIYLRGGDPKG